MYKSRIKIPQYEALVGIGTPILILTLITLCFSLIALYSAIAHAEPAEYQVVQIDYPELIPPPPPPPPPAYKLVVDKSNFTMDIFRDGQWIDQRRVIIGKKGRETPTLTTQFSNIELNPIWDVPKSIADDMVRKFKHKKDPIAYIERNGYYFVSKNDGAHINPREIDWKTISGSGPYEFHIKQEAGHLNMLGPVMFVLEHNMGVQMHGTANPELFEKPVRKFSSGCIRVDGAGQLAAVLLDKSDDEFEQYRKKVGNKWIKLPVPVTVEVVD
jgi:murein L,D-transpeptidase YcbB/YkuD